VSLLLGVLADLAGAGTLGASLLAGLLLVSARDRGRAMTLLAILGGAWTLVQLALLLPGPSAAPIIGAVLAAALTLLAAGVRSRGAAQIVAVLAVCGIAVRVLGEQGALLPRAATALPVLVHVLAMSPWVGGLGALLVLRAAGPLDAAPRVLARFSHLALLAWCLLAGSGLWALIARLAAPTDLLTTGPGRIGLLKALLLLALGVLGALQRRHLAAPATPAPAAPGSAGPPPAPARPFLRLAGIEMVLMILAVVLGGVLARLPAPGALRADGPTGPAVALTGRSLPSAPSPLTVLTSWQGDALILAVALALLFALRLPGRPRLPRPAQARVAVGCLLLVLVCCGPLAVYAPVLSSAHLLQQGLLLVLVGPLLASGIPTPTPLRRLLEAEPWTAPVLALAPVGLLVLVHATPWLLRPALATIPGRELLLLAAAGLGALTWWVVDPGARLRRGRAARGILAALPVAALAAGALGLALGDALLGADRFGATGRTWRADALADQQTGGWALLVLAAAAGIALAVRALTARRALTADGR
jgi:putative copper export protein/cytochrome c oxidase assembly factor CtaG